MTEMNNSNDTDITYNDLEISDVDNNYDECTLADDEDEHFEWWLKYGNR